MNRFVFTPIQVQKIILKKFFNGGRSPHKEKGLDPCKSTRSPATYTPFLSQKPFSVDLDFVPQSRRWLAAPRLGPESRGHQSATIPPCAGTPSHLQPLPKMGAPN